MKHIKAKEITHGKHAKKPGSTKCGLKVFKLPDGNHRVVRTNVVGQINCPDCLKANKPGEV